MKRIEINGLMVGEDIHDESCTVCKDIVNEIKSTHDDIELFISSCGGDVEGGTEIAVALGQWRLANPENEINVEIGALCASAAANLLARILPYTSKITAHDDSMIMYHSCSGMVEGSPSVLRDVAERMDKVNGLIIKSLIRYTSLEETTIRGWFEAGREGWLTGQEALEAGLVTELVKEPSKFIQPSQGGLEVYNVKKLIATWEYLKMKNKELKAECDKSLSDKPLSDKPLSDKSLSDKPECIEPPAVTAEENVVETTAECGTAECGTAECGTAECEDKGFVVEEVIENAENAEQLAEQLAEQPTAECGTECGTECEKDEKDAKIEELTAECENLKKELEALKAKCKAGLKPSCVVAKAKTFPELVREIPKGLTANQYGAAFAKLKAEHKGLYDEYMKSRSERI